MKLQYLLGGPKITDQSLQIQKEDNLQPILLYLPKLSTMLKSRIQIFLDFPKLTISFPKLTPFLSFLGCYGGTYML